VTSQATASELLLLSMHASSQKEETGKIVTRKVLPQIQTHDPNVDPTGPLCKWTAGSDDWTQVLGGLDWRCLNEGMS